MDQAAERTGAPAGQYARPTYRFRVRVAGLKAESPDLLYRDHVDLAWDADTDRPASGAAVTVALADGTTLETELGEDGRQRLGDVPPGPVTAAFGPDTRAWEPREPSGRPAPDFENVSLVDFSLAPAETVLLASNGLDPALLAELAGQPDDDGDGFVEWLWGTIRGDFNEDPSYEEIAGAMALSFVPVLGQIADIRDIIANIYLIARDDGRDKRWAWLGLVVTLVGVVPVFGDVLKGCFRFVIRGLRSGMEPAARLLRRAFEELGMGNPRLWFETNVDVAEVINTARAAFDTAADYVVHKFDELADRILAMAETARSVQNRLDGIRISVLGAFGVRTGRSEPSRVVRNLTGAVSSLRVVSRQLDAMKEAANAKIAEGVDELVEGLEELFEVELRQAGDGVSGSVVSPSRGSEASRAALRAARRQTAFDFYQKAGYNPSDIPNHLKGIDFDQPVIVITIPAGARVRQLQPRGATFQGHYYYVEDATPSQLGVAPHGIIRGTNDLLPKVDFHYDVSVDTPALMSTAAPITDTWSMEMMDGTQIPYDTVGGAIQYFAPTKPNFVLSP